MRTFNEYRESKTEEELAALLVEAGIDSDEFCDLVLETAGRTDNEDELIVELWGGVKNLAQGAWNGIKNNVGPMMQQAGQAIGNSYKTGEKVTSVQKAQKSLTDLKASLEQLGFDQQSVSASLGSIHQQLQQAVANVQQQGHGIGADQMFPLQQNRAGQGPVVQGM